MTKDFLASILSCPKCQTTLKVNIANNRCPRCQFEYKKVKGIWHLLYLPKRILAQSQREYEQIHQKKFARVNDGSYEILASFARGARTVDIACGDGYIEQLAPKTVGVDFSLAALKKAQVAGAKYLVLADAHYLPFRNDTFELAISTGNLEHFASPELAINEMARISKIQILIVHKQLPLPFAQFFFNLITSLFKIKHQPIEKPINIKSLETMLAKAGLHVVFKGVWTLPVNYGHVIRFLPEFTNIPSCSFIISIKK